MPYRKTVNDLNNYKNNIYEQIKRLNINSVQMFNMLSNSISNNDFSVLYMIINKFKNKSIYNFCMREASIYGRLDIIKMLINKNINIHFDNDTNLKQAIIFNQYKLVQFFIENNCKLNSVSLAFYNKKMLKLLLRNKRKLKLYQLKNSDIIKSISYDVSIIKLLYTNFNFDVNLENNKLLYDAVLCSNLKVGRFLLKNNAIINDKILNLAEDIKNENIIRILYKHFHNFRSH